MIQNRIKKYWCVELVLLVAAGCASTNPNLPRKVFREPWEMVAPLAQRETLSTQEASTETAVSTGAAKGAKGTHKRPTTASDAKKSEMAPEHAVESARNEATQHPTSDGFIDAVQLYDFEAGAIYEVLTAPGFVTILRLQPGEQITQLAAGDTSRWLIETIESGLADPPGTLDDGMNGSGEPSQPMRVSVLVKPRRPMIETNLVLSTSHRTYLVHLKSVSNGAYHSMVEWTYPKSPTLITQKAFTKPGEYNPQPVQNYAYVVKVEDDEFPPQWAPVSVYDDGHRVHVHFSDSINDIPRPPLFIVGDDRSLRLVNYQVQDKAYVVHELFDRAVLRLGGEAVLIERLRR